MPIGSPLSSSAGSPPPGQPAAPPSRQEIERKLSVHSISIQDSPHQRTRMQRKGSLPLPMPSSPTHQGPSSFFPPPLSGFLPSSSPPASVQRSLSLQSPSSLPSSRLPPLSISSPVDPSSSASTSISSPSSALPPNNNPPSSTQQQPSSNLPTSTSQNLAAISETAGMRTFSDSENELDYEGEDEEDEEEDEEGEEGEEDGEMRRKVEGERVLKSGYLEKKGEKRKNWKKRWFVLRTEKLSYYKDDREYKLLRLIDLHDIHSVALVQLKKYSSAICLVTQARTYYVKARTTNDAESWVEAIKLAKKDLKESDEAKTRSPPQGGAGTLPAGGGGGTPVASRRMGGSASSTGGGPSFPSSTPAGPPSNRSVSPSHSASSTGGGVGLFNPSSPLLSSSSQSSAPNSPPSPLRINPNQPEWSISPTTIVSPNNITNSSPIDLRPPSSPTRGGNASSSEDEDFDEAPTPAPQVISTDPNKVILSGYLMKMGKRKNWRKRWFVLTSGSLVYCSSHMDTKPHRIIPLSRILDALEYEPATKESSLSNPLRSMSDNSNSADPSSSLGTPVKAMGPSSSMGGGLGGGGGDKSKQHVEHSLKIVTAKKAFILCAPSEEEEIKWLSAIQALVARRTKGPQPATATAAAKPQTSVQIPPLPHSSSSSTIRASSQPTSPTLQANIPTIHEQPPSPPAVPPSTVPGSNVLLAGQPRSRTPSPSRQPTPQTHSQYLPSIESQISSSEKFPATTRSGSESETGGGASSSSAKEKVAAAPVVRRERSDTTAGKEAVENVRRLYHPEEPQS